MTSKTSFITCVLVLVGAALSMVWLMGVIKPEPPVLNSGELGVGAYRSDISIPMAIQVKTVEQELERTVPRQVKGQNGIRIGGNVSKERVNYTINRGAIILSAEGGRLVARTHIGGKATVRGKYCPGGKMLPCKWVQETAKFGGNVTATINDVGLNPDWSIRATPSVAVDIDKAYAYILGFKVTFRGELQSAINKAIPSAIGDLKNAMANSIKVRAELEKVWDEVDHIYQVSEEPSVWASINPVEVGMSPVRFENDQIKATIRLGFETATYLGQEPVVPKKGLPDELSAAAGGQFSVVVPNFLDLSEVSQAVRSNTDDVHVPIGTDSSVTFKDFTLEEGANKLIVRAKFRMSGFGSPHGTVYFVGKPLIEGNVLRVTELSYDVRSNQKLLDGAAELAKPAVIGKVEEELTFDLSESIASAITEANEAASSIDLGNGVELSGSVDSASVDDVQVGDGKLMLVVSVRGDLQVRMSDQAMLADNSTNQ